VKKARSDSKLKARQSQSSFDRELAGAVRSQYATAVRLRRKLHQHPELAFSEFQTGKTIAAELRRIGCQVTTGIGRTGVLGVLENGADGPVVAVRSDMDALPVEEMTGLTFASKNPGVMHACGHDAHMSIVVSTAAAMARMRAHWSGTIKFIFQPSEEVVPGGALGIIADGVLENPDVETIVGVHVDPWIPVGRVGFKDGPMMAQADDFVLTVIGKSGHGARPHLGVDAIHVASQIVTALQSIVSRSTDPLQPAVLSIGKIVGGSASNILADSVRLEGTLRVLDAKEAVRLRKHLERTASGVARALGGKIQFDYCEGYPVLVNAKPVNDLLRASTCQAYGKKAVVEIRRPLMGGEDFARYLQRVTGAMMRLGVGNPKVGAKFAWHHPKFTIDENALGIGTRIICGALLLQLGRSDSVATVGTADA
jgi:amidohydrolase